MKPSNPRRQSRNKVSMVRGFGKFGIKVLWKQGKKIQNFSNPFGLGTLLEPSFGVNFAGNTGKC
jgi:hypothetical protein